MSLTKYNLGELIEQVIDKNTDLKYRLDDLKGLSVNKTFIETKADMLGVSLKPYLIVKPSDFAYVTVTSRNSDKITLAYNNSQDTYIVSSSYVVFRVKETGILNSSYLFMYFNRPEFDRFSRFNSWGSARETFSYEDLCDVEIELPDIKIQQKYVDIYNSMLANQQNCEKGLDDLKLVCDAYIEDLRRKIPSQEIGEYIKNTDRKTDNANFRIQGISKQQKFIDSESKTQGVDKNKYIVVEPMEFGYSPIHINDGSIALNDSNDTYLLSPIYKTFKTIDENLLLSEYLMMWFARSEFTRYCWFYAFGSARDNFEWSQMCEFRIPIPDIEVQKAIVDIYKCYKKQKEISQKLKEQIKNICPILIKGAIGEGKR
ncbi:restriction endonuclease subunit S [Campylobacter magnus]|uniref:restriction endonuclease subunit S n=1 Tax=Campylobacter magnus TaxID=3026462 RepID=UPI0026DEBF88|nr:restriction endonuclease subunit S [Campylobacter magnus]MDO2407878.1 restriction endonuclease subunit S [Campylobacter magnus]